jgi:putative acetyltransferase
MAVADPIVIRRGRDEDADALHRLSLAAIAGSAAAHYDERQRAAWSARRTPAGHRRMLRETTTFVALAGTAIAGFSSVALRPVAGLHAGEVDQLFVDPRHGGRGVARLLLEAVEAAAVQAGIRELSTHASWRAVPVFEALGYRRCGTETVDVAGVTLTRVQMRRSLPAS